MLKFNPIHLAAAVAIALSGPVALAQTTGGTPPVAPSGIATTTGTNSTPATPAASPNSSGSCAGTGGSSCTANTSSNTTSGNTTTSSTTPTPGVRDASRAAAPSTPNQSAGSSGSAMGTNQTTVDSATTRPGSFEPGGTFGPQGTNNPGTDNQGNNNQGNGNNNQGFNAVPGNFIGGVGSLAAPGDTTTMAGNPSQQTVVIQQPSSARSATPLLDQTTRDAQARETRRRNSKQEPRIIGIAPNTERDLTNQMPDDRIIRY